MSFYDTEQALNTITPFPSYILPVSTKSARTRRDATVSSTNYDCARFRCPLEVKNWSQLASVCTRAGTCSETTILRNYEQIRPKGPAPCNRKETRTNLGCIGRLHVPLERLFCFLCSTFRVSNGAESFSAFNLDESSKLRLKFEGCL